ncbi:MAG: rubrerythrin family protein [Firmicutes bacterium]|nr:rubrerythrin family protein [Bacillota bacterium]
MIDSCKLSPESYRLIRELQQNEVNEEAVYLRLARRVKKESDRQVLEGIARDEARHVQFWSQYTQEKMRPQTWRVLFFMVLSAIFGYTFAIKIMERGERNAQEIYRLLAHEIPEAQKIAVEEELHEEQIANLLDEERLQYVGSMVLGMNDALVELTGTLVGLSFALKNTKLVALSGLITGISAALSMASSEYLSVRSEGSANAAKASLYTGVMYILAVACLVAPYFVISSQGYLYAVGIMFLIVLALIYTFTYYISVALDQPFTQKFVEMASISLSVAALSFLVGYGVKLLLGIDL